MGQVIEQVSNRKSNTFDFRVITGNIINAFDNVVKLEDINVAKKKEWEQKFLTDTKNCQSIYLGRNIDSKTRLKYERLKLVLATENSKKMQMFDDYDSMQNSYKKRLKLVFNYMKALLIENKSEKDIINERYAIQEIIQKEVINYYKSETNNIKNRRIMNKELGKYVAYLKNIDDLEYVKYASALEDDKILQESQNEKEKNEEEIMKLLRDNDFVISPKKSLELIQPNILDVLYEVCPEYRDMMKGKQRH